MDGGRRHDRRQILKIFTIGGVATAVVLPSSWTKPLVRAVIVPAHAAASPHKTTTRSPTTTSIATTGTQTAVPVPPPTSQTAVPVPPPTTPSTAPSTTLGLFPIPLPTLFPGLGQ